MSSGHEDLVVILGAPELGPAVQPGPLKDDDRKDAVRDPLGGSSIQAT